MPEPLYTIPEFAEHVRGTDPARYKTMQDQDVVSDYVKKYPAFANKVEQAQFTPAAMTRKEVLPNAPPVRVASNKEFVNEAIAAIPDAAMIGASLVAPEVAAVRFLPRPVINGIGRFVAGAGGEAARQWVADKFNGDPNGPKTAEDRMTKAGVSGAVNAGFGMVGDAAQKFLTGWYRPKAEVGQTMLPNGKYPATAPINSQDVAKANAVHGFGLTTGEVNESGASVPKLLQWLGDKSPLGRLKANEKQAIGAGRAAQFAENQTSILNGAPLGPQTTGVNVGAAIETGKDISSTETNRRYVGVDKEAQSIPGGVVVDLDPTYRDIADMWDREVRPILGQNFTPSKNVQSLMGMMQGQRFVSFGDADQIRKHLSSATKEIGELNSTAAQGMAARIRKSIDAQMEAAAVGSGSPSVMSKLRDARSFHEDVMNTYQRSAIPGFIRGSVPEKAFDLIAPGAASTVDHAKKAILDIAVAHGTPAQAAEAKQVWNSFREQWLHTHILGDAERQGMTLDSLVGMKDKMNKWGPGVLGKMFDDSEGKAVMTNLKTVAEAMSRMKVPSPGGGLGYHSALKWLAAPAAIAGGGYAGGGEGAGIAAGAAGTMILMPGAFSYALHSKRLTNLLTQGLVNGKTNYGTWVANLGRTADAINAAYQESQNTPEDAPKVTNRLAGTPADSYHVTVEPPSPKKKAANPYESAPATAAPAKTKIANPYEN